MTERTSLFAQKLRAYRIGRAGHGRMTQEELAAALDVSVDAISKYERSLSYIRGDLENRLAGNLNLSFSYVEGESMMMAIKDVAVSSGSACKSGSPEPTHVLIAMGREPEEAHWSVRLSLSRYTEEADVHRTIEALEQVLREMESTVRFLPCK